MGNSDEIYAQQEHDERQAQRQELAQLRSRVRRLEEVIRDTMIGLSVSSHPHCRDAHIKLATALAPAPAKAHHERCAIDDPGPSGTCNSCRQETCDQCINGHFLCYSCELDRGGCEACRRECKPAGQGGGE